MHAVIPGRANPMHIIGLGSRRLKALGWLVQIGRDGGKDDGSSGFSGISIRSEVFWSLRCVITAIEPMFLNIREDLAVAKASADVEP